MKILIADDEAMSRRLLQSTLERAGYEVIAVGPVPVTMSLGLLLSHQWGTRSVEELLREADTALYAAKAAGRNCVKLASPTPALGVPDSRLNEPARQR